MTAADPFVVVVCGIAGSGKSTIGLLLAERVGAAFIDGDDLHPPANVAKMAAGHPLDDTDREPWLAAIGDWIDRRLSEGRAGVVTCSALKRRYRDTLRRPGVCFVFLRVSQELAERRVADRPEHFMPASLVASQLADLELPQPDEQVIEEDADERPANAIVDEVVKRLQAG